MKLSILFLHIFLVSAISFVEAQGNPAPPGTVINHMPKSTGKYIGSPAICILPNGDYVASHDEFGPRSSEFYSAITHVFSSSDKGRTWTEISKLDGQFWSNLFVHGRDLYIMGTNKHHGNVVIRKSTDGGKTWTLPYDGKNGLILEGEYHTAPMPTVVHGKRIWRAIEYATGKTSQWGKRYSAMVVSAPIGSDLLNAGSWTHSGHLPFDSTYLEGQFGAWLEGNVVVSPKGKMVDVLRVHAPGLPDEYSAIIDVDDRGRHVSFDKNDFVKMPGASKKFTIRYDDKTKLYWSIVNNVPPDYIGKTSNDRLRNSAALVSSPDLREWKINKTLLFHPDYKNHAFQYIDWLFDGDDIIFVSRTAFDDEEGGAQAAHDANFLTFHRVNNFRQYYLK